MLKCPHYPKQAYRFSAMSIKIPIAFFTEIEKSNSKVPVEPQKTPKSQRVLRKKNSTRGLSLPGLQLRRAKQPGARCRHRPLEQRNGMQGCIARTHPLRARQPVLDEGEESTQWRTEVSSVSGAGNTGLSRGKDQGLTCEAWSHSS